MQGSAEDLTLICPAPYTELNVLVVESPKMPVTISVFTLLTKEQEATNETSDEQKEPA